MLQGATVLFVDFNLENKTKNPCVFLSVRRSTATAGYFCQQALPAVSAERRSGSAELLSRRIMQDCCPVQISPAAWATGSWSVHHMSSCECGAVSSIERPEAHAVRRLQSLP